MWRPRYNIAPTQAVIVVGDDGKRYLKLMRWGLIPSWATDHVSTRPIPMPKEASISLCPLPRQEQPRPVSLQIQKR